MRDRRVVITGSPGSGKTATGNTIFGRRVFTFSIIPNNVAMSCGSTNEEFGDPRWFLVVDTPSPLTPAHRDQCMTLCAPGPHAFLLTLRAGRFTAEDKAEIQRLELLFGEEMYNYTIVLFTHSDSIEANGKTLQDHIENANPDLKNLLEKCGQRYHTFDSRNHSDRKQGHCSELC
ncbi:hypothetical protein MATL_G00116060 [Megalops atlanticus]|uniref:AIG1-type G domain-containing protein n=1 Tax=Megalops atlanticus TaxID=7932 RepID=A0A9D3PXR5_MEGAT|nr:hypothetical protein MATL_G00116060 [Megalops atlanticus]